MNKTTFGWILCSLLLLAVASAEIGNVDSTTITQIAESGGGRILTTTNGNFAFAGDHFIEADSGKIKAEYQEAMKLFYWSEHRAYDRVTHEFVDFPMKEKRYAFKEMDVQMVDGHYILEGFDYSKLEGINLANIKVRR